MGCAESQDVTKESGTALSRQSQSSDSWCSRQQVILWIQQSRNWQSELRRGQSDVRASRTRCATVCSHNAGYMLLAYCRYLKPHILLTCILHAHCTCCSPLDQRPVYISCRRAAQATTARSTARSKHSTRASSSNGTEGSNQSKMTIRNLPRSSA